jgi:hypothetical protein
VRRPVTGPRSATARPGSTLTAVPTLVAYPAVLCWEKEMDAPSLRWKERKGSVVYIQWHLWVNITQHSGTVKYATRRIPEKHFVVCYLRMVHFGFLEDTSTGEVSPKKLPICLGLQLLDPKSWLKAQTNMPLALSLLIIWAMVDMLDH